MSRWRERERVEEGSGAGAGRGARRSAERPRGPPQPGEGAGRALGLEGRGKGANQQVPTSKLAPRLPVRRAKLAPGCESGTSGHVASAAAGDGHGDAQAEAARRARAGDATDRYACEAAAATSVCAWRSGALDGAGAGRAEQPRRASWRWRWSRTGHRLTPSSSGCRRRWRVRHRTGATPRRRGRWVC